MKKTIILIILFVFLSLCLQAESEQPAGTENSSRVTRTWNGSVSTNWHTPGNWSDPSVPTATEDVVIPGGLTNYPVTSISAYCKSITINTGANITVGAGNLNVTLSADIYGQLRMNGSGDLIAGSSISWESGATANITSTSSDILCGASMRFYSGSNVQLAMGIVEFNGPTDSNLYNYSANTQLNILQTRVSGTGGFIINSASNQPFTINGSFTNFSGYNVNNYFSGSITLKGSLNDYNSGLTTGIKWNAGTLIMDGTSQSIYVQGLSSYLNHLTISPTASVGVQYPLDVRGNLLVESGSMMPSSTVSVAGNLTVQNSSLYLSAPMTVSGNVTINTSGYLSSNNQTITVSGNWSNNVGPSAFGEGTGRVIFTGSLFQYCNYTETFYTLEINKSGGAFRINNSAAVITCTQYDWTAGAVDVLIGTFTANDLYDNGIYGNYYVNTGATINLTNNDGYIDLNGNLTFSGGGTINVYGGTYDSIWPYSANASITMSGGILDFKNRGIHIANSATYTFNDNITEGTIRTSRDFWCNRTDFNPTGGTIELYGSLNASITQLSGSNFFNLVINKSYSREETNDSPIFETDRLGNIALIYRDNQVTTSNLDINSSFLLVSGLFIAPSQMNVGGIWQNYAGSPWFSEGVNNLVVFDGSGNSSIYYNEEFCHLEINKSETGTVIIWPDCSVICETYNWTGGKLFVRGGWFTANDMVDEAILGTIELTSGYINFYQETTQWLDLRADITISGGELHLYGINGDPYWPYDCNASLTMSGGIINIHDSGLYIYNDYNFTTNITGGTIMMTGDFTCHRADFNPAGGTIQLYGSLDSEILMTAGTLYNLVVSKFARDNDENLPDSVTRLDRAGNETTHLRANTAYIYAPGLTCNGDISVNAGKLHVWGTTLNCDGNIHLSQNLELSNPDYASNLSMKADKAININSGGTFTSIGSSSFTNLVTNATGYTAFNVNSGGTIGAIYTILEKMNTFGVNVKDGAFVDIANPFLHCIFRNGIADGTLLTIDNDQTILVTEADFPPNTWSGGPNVSKNLDQGTVTFQNATGMWSGETYDYDPYNRINWTSTILPDLVITDAFWSDTEPLVGDLVTLTVTVSNLGVSGLTVPTVYLDFYWNMASPPTWGMLGNQYQSISSLPPGESQTVYFDVQYYTPGLWTSWLQIDTDYFQEELNEDNNVYGPIYLTWMPLALPAIADLSIELAPGTYYKRLNWTYPQSVSHFNIYRSEVPYFTPGAGTFIANVTYPTMEYVDTTTGDKYFYIVTAEQVTAALPSIGTPRNHPKQQRRIE